MARPPKSKELKAIQGTLRPDRDRVPQKRILDQKELPSPQLDLQDHGLDLFKALCIHLNDAGVIWQVDAMMLSMYCKNRELLQEASDSITRLDDLVQEFDNGVIQISPALTVFEKLSKTVITLGAKLGLSPADREKLASLVVAFLFLKRLLNRRRKRKKKPMLKTRAQIGLGLTTILLAALIGVAVFVTTFSLSF